MPKWERCVSKPTPSHKPAGLLTDFALRLIPPHSRVLYKFVNSNSSGGWGGGVSKVKKKIRDLKILEMIPCVKIWKVRLITETAERGHKGDCDTQRRDMQLSFISSIKDHLTYLSSLEKNENQDPFFTR